jgi:ABC-type amino acid transport substrate-binding protein
LAVAALLLFSGCNPSDPTPAKRLTPKVQPPAIKQGGTLRIGVDLSYPPFAGVEDGEQAGIDIDVGSALAARLGLKPEFVNIPRSQIASALAENDADVILSAPFSTDVLSRGSMAGTYIADGPALFAHSPAAAEVTTASVIASDSARVGAQIGSEAYWFVLGQRDAETITGYATLKDAFDALARNQVDYVACDQLVGAYLARDRQGVRYTGALTDAHLLGVVVATENEKLADAVRSGLDGLSADGVLDTIRGAWAGEVPKLPLPADRSASATESVSATP